MKRKPIVLLLLCMALQTFSGGQEEPARIECNGNSKENRPQRKKLWDGYEVSLGPARNATEDAGCTAAIYNARTQVVFRTTDYTVSLWKKWTGKDIDGDGHPDVVFLTEVGGMPYDDCHLPIPEAA